MCAASASEIGIGFLWQPRNPVTLGVFLRYAWRKRGAWTDLASFLRDNGGPAGCAARFASVHPKARYPGCIVYRCPGTGRPYLIERSLSYLRRRSVRIPPPSVPVPRPAPPPLNRRDHRGVISELRSAHKPHPNAAPSPGRGAVVLFHRTSRRARNVPPHRDSFGYALPPPAPPPASISDTSARSISMVPSNHLCAVSPLTPNSWIDSSKVLRTAAYCSAR